MIVNDLVGQREVFVWFFRMLPERLAPNPSASWGESRLSIASLPPHRINVFAPAKEAEKKPHLFFRTGLGADRAWHNCGRCRNFRDRQLQSSTQLPILLAQPFALRKRFSGFRVLEVGCAHIKNCSLLQNAPRSRIAKNHRSLAHPSRSQQTQISMHQFVGATGVLRLGVGIRRRIELNQLLRIEGSHAGKLLTQNLNRFGDVLLPGSIILPFGEQASIWRTRKSWSSVNLFFCSLTALSTRNSKATSTGFSPSLRSTSTNHWKSFSPTR